MNNEHQSYNYYDNPTGLSFEPYHNYSKPTIN